MKPRVATALWACALGLITTHARSQDNTDLADLSLEQLMDFNVESVYSASRYQQLVTQAPSSISIVTADEIRRAGYTQFADVIRSVRGLFVTDDRNYLYVGVRGFNRPGDYNTRLLVMVDGHRLNDNVYDSGSVGRDGMIDVELIERVEVIRGPSSSLYGSSAFFGIINVVTKRGKDFSKAEVAQEAGSLNTYRTRATYGAEFDNGVDWLASATHYTSTGDEKLYYPAFDQRRSDDPRARHDGVARDLDDEDASKFFSSVRYGGLTATAYLSERSKQVPTASYDSLFDDPNNRTKDQRGYLDVTFDTELATNLTYRARGYYEHYEYTGSVPFDYAEPGDPADVVIYRDRAVGEWVGSEMHLTGTLASRYNFVVGAEYRANLRQDQYAYEDHEEPYFDLNEESSSNVLGAFAQMEIVLRDDLRVTTGVRHDRYSHDIGSTTNPRFAAIYNPTDRSAVKLLYGGAFRAPNPYERFYYYDAQQFQPTLKPETIKTTELVYEHYIGAHYRLNVSAYDYSIEDLIGMSATDDGARYYGNADSVRAHGLELEIEARYRSGLTARASYTLQRAQDDANSTDLTSSPRQLGKVSLTSPLWQTGVYSHLGLQYHDSSLTLSGARSPSFLLTDVSITTDRLWQNVELSFSVNNLFDQDHVYPAAAEHLQDTLRLNGRTVHGKIAIRF